MDEECTCGLNQWEYACWDQTIWGPCDYGPRNGQCEPILECGCECHD